MKLTIELPNHLASAVQMQASQQGIEPEGLVCRMVELALTRSLPKDDADKSFVTRYGVFAHYGPAPSAEEIDANRAEMLRGFAEDL